jgi:hypothetical protein
MKMAVFWDVALCSLVEVYQCFWGACCLHQAAQTPETSTIFHQTTQYNNPEDSRLQIKNV